MRLERQLTPDEIKQDFVRRNMIDFLDALREGSEGLPEAMRKEAEWNNRVWRVLQSLVLAAGISLVTPAEIRDTQPEKTTVMRMDNEEKPKQKLELTIRSHEDGSIISNEIAGLPIQPDTQRFLGIHSKEIPKAHLIRLDDILEQELRRKAEAIANYKRERSEVVMDAIDHGDGFVEELTEGMVKYIENITSTESEDIFNELGYRELIETFKKHNREVQRQEMTIPELERTLDHMLEEIRVEYEKNGGEAWKKIQNDYLIPDDKMEALREVLQTYSGKGFIALMRENFLPSESLHVRETLFNFFVKYGGPEFLAALPSKDSYSHDSLLIPGSHPRGTEMIQMKRVIGKHIETTLHTIGKTLGNRPFETFEYLKQTRKSPKIKPLEKTQP